MARLLQAVVDVNTPAEISGYHVFESEKPIPFPGVESMGNNRYKAPFTIKNGHKEVVNLFAAILGTLDGQPTPAVSTEVAVNTKVAERSVPAPVIVPPVHKEVPKPTASEKSLASNLHKAPRQTYNGHSVTGLLRALGKAKWTEAEATKVLVQLKIQAAPSTIRAWLMRGAAGQHGEPAALTKADWAQLNAIRIK